MATTLILTNVFTNGEHVTECRNFNGKLLLTINNTSDVKAMEVAGLDPSTDEDVFTYANHLLGNRFSDFLYNHIEENPVFDRHTLVKPTLGRFEEVFGNVWDDISFGNDTCDSIGTTINKFDLQLFVPNSKVNNQDEEETNEYALFVWLDGEQLSDSPSIFSNLENAVSGVSLVIELINKININ